MPTRSCRRTWFSKESPGNSCKPLATGSLVTSDAVITEVVRTLGKDRIQRKYGLTAADAQGVRLLLEHEAIKTPITTVVHGVATHPEDDWILATAVSGQADYLVTGDRQLQALGMYQGVRIVSPRQFAAVLGLSVDREPRSDLPE